VLRVQCRSIANEAVPCEVSEKSFGFHRHVVHHEKLNGSWKSGASSDVALKPVSPRCARRSRRARASLQLKPAGVRHGQWHTAKARGASERASELLGRFSSTQGVRMGTTCRCVTADVVSVHTHREHDALAHSVYKNCSVVCECECVCVCVCVCVVVDQVVCVCVCVCVCVWW
jgi:hypothetical protein